MKGLGALLRYGVPLLILAGFVGLAYVGLQRDPRLIPSPLVNRPAPPFATAVLDAGPPVSLATVRAGNRPVLVNFFASWCAGCRDEHPVFLARARRDGVTLYGVAYKDEPGAARQWLAALGDPYTRVLADPAGAMGLNYGVYGIPETFIVGPDGRVLYKQVGPVTEAVWDDEILPRLRGTKR